MQHRKLLLLLGGMVALGLSIGSATPLITNGLVAAYEFNGNANDYTGVYNGVSTGAVATTDRFGNANQAFYFNGTAYVTAELYGDIGGTNGIFTISAWAKSYKTTYISGQDGFILNMGRGAEADYSISLLGSNAAPVRYGGTYTTASVTNILTWNLYTMTYDGTTFKYYINGALMSSVAKSPGGVIDAAYPLRIGGQSKWVGGGRFLEGDIDDVLIYNRNLSQAEVQTLYGTSIPEPASLLLCVLGALALWRYRQR